MEQVNAAPEEKTAETAEIAETAVVEPTPFAVGDVVRLNSGGAMMTVYCVEKYHSGVFWMTDEGVTEPVRIASACLTKVSDSASGKMTNMDMLKDFAGDVLSYVVAIVICVKLGITSVSSEVPRPAVAVALLCILLGIAMAKKYFANRSK